MEDATETRLFDKEAHEMGLRAAVDSGSFGIATSEKVPRGTFVSVEKNGKQWFQRTPREYKLGDFLCVFLDELRKLGATRRLLKCIVLHPQDYEELARTLNLGADRTENIQDVEGEDDGTGCDTEISID